MISILGKIIYIFLSIIIIFIKIITEKKMHDKKIDKLYYKKINRVFILFSIFSCFYFIILIKPYYFENKIIHDLERNNSTNKNYVNILQRYLELPKADDDFELTDEYVNSIQYYLEALKKEDNSQFVDNYEKVIQLYLKLLKEKNNSENNSDLKEISRQISTLTSDIISINNKIDNLNSKIEQNNSKDIISSCITGICTIIAAIIAGLVAIKVAKIKSK